MNNEIVELALVMASAMASDGYENSSRALIEFAREIEMSSREPKSPSFEWCLDTLEELRSEPLQSNTETMQDRLAVS